MDGVFLTILESALQFFVLLFLQTETRRSIASSKPDAIYQTPTMMWNHEGLENLLKLGEVVVHITISLNFSCLLSICSKG
jgi:hypothetical protein